MSNGRLSVISVSRRRVDGTEESLAFEEGVNVLVGEGNTGKTKWFQTIDYLFGDEVKAEERQDPENVLFALFDSASAVFKINGEEVSVERRWKEPGSLSKVYVNGEAQNVKDYCQELMQRLGMPILRYPQGNPYGPRKWPELTWRTLFRHMYRREDLWSDLADAQPEVDQHAVLTLLLGAAEQLFSEDQGELVAKNKRLAELQARRDNFMSLLDQVSKELVGADELGVALTPDSIEGAQARLQRESKEIEAKREKMLLAIRSGAEKQLLDDKTELPDIGRESQRLIELQAQRDEVGRATRHTEDRLAELATTRQLLEDESAKLLRAKEAGIVLADLRVTHCPACDQLVDKRADDHLCYVCGQQVVSQSESTNAGTRRVEFESEQLRSELEETRELLDELKKELEKRRILQRDLTGEIAEIEKTLRPVRQAAAAVLPPELFLLDVNYGRLQEKSKQLDRIRAVLDQREALAAEILKIQQEIVEIEAKVDTSTSQVDLETMGDRIRDGMITYFNRIKQLNPNSWLGNTVSVHFRDRAVRFKVGESGWKAKLGGTQKLYFLFAYHYALLSLSHYPDTLYPGFVMIDFPASLEDRAAIADKENFILQPFVELLQREDMKGCQALVAGRSFKDLNDVHIIEFDQVWK